MSQGLGDTQRRALAALTVPLTVPELGATISTKPRHTRRIVAALTDRGLVISAIDGGGPRLVWRTEQRDEALADLKARQELHEHVQWLLAQVREGPTRPTHVNCPNCNTWVRTGA